MASDSIFSSLMTLDLERNLVVQSNYIVWIITGSYVMFTKVIGPNIMKNRKPMELKLTMLLYNSVMMAFNGYLSVLGIKLAVDMWPYRCSFGSSPIYTETKKFYKIGSLCLLAKFLELFDTVIFVLRKKYQQVSFLHVFHHSIVFTMYWMALKFLIIRYVLIFFGSINLTVHVILYLYYALSALGPNVRRYLWWKRYLTTLQITRDASTSLFKKMDRLSKPPSTLGRAALDDFQVQFFVTLAYMIYSAMAGCDSYNYFDKACVIVLIIITVLFLNFYIQTYTNTGKYLDRITCSFS